MAAFRQGCKTRQLFSRFSRLHGNSVTRACAQQKPIEEPNDSPLIVDDDSHYPPIKPKFPPGSWGEMDRKLAWLWEEKRCEIAKEDTVMGKLDYLTQHKYRTWNYAPVALVPNLFNYQCDKTKTYAVQESRENVEKHSRLPDLYKEIRLDNSVVDDCEKLLRNYIETFDYVNRSKAQKKMNLLIPRINMRAAPQLDNQLSHLQSKELLMTLISYLSGHYEHVRTSTVDENVRVACTWDRHGVKRFKNTLKGDPMMPFYKTPNNFVVPNDASFLADHCVNFQIRKEKPMSQFIKMTDRLIETVTYPSYPYKPTVCGQTHTVMRRGVEPGFNVGDPNPFIHLSVVMLNERHLIHMLNNCGEKAYREALFGYALSTGFIAAVAQAHYQGFNTYEDLTYPITTQTILTDGQQYMFSAYQLNTLQLWKDDIAVPYHNVCWISQPQALWQEGETMDGESQTVIDRKTLETLLKFLVCPSADIEDTAPFLNKETKHQLEDGAIPKIGEEPRPFSETFLGNACLENGFKIGPIGQNNLYHYFEN